MTYDDDDDPNKMKSGKSVAGDDIRMYFELWPQICLLRCCPNWLLKLRKKLWDSRSSDIENFVDFLFCFTYYLLSF